MRTKKEGSYLLCHLLSIQWVCLLRGEEFTQLQPQQNLQFTPGGQNLDYWHHKWLIRADVNYMFATKRPSQRYPSIHHNQVFIGWSFVIRCEKDWKEKSTNSETLLSTSAVAPYSCLIDLPVLWRCCWTNWEVFTYKESFRVCLNITYLHIIILS